MIQVMLLTLEMERGTSWELELGKLLCFKVLFGTYKSFWNYLSLFNNCHVEY